MMDKSIEHWVERWRTCHPATYPPELWKEVSEEYRSGCRLFGLGRTVTITRGVCARCGERLETAHMCEDIRQYHKERE